MTLEFSQLGLAPELIDYSRGWDIQRELHGKVVAG
ncbi:MAG: lipoyl(octanoyl) transferase, partial [Arthrobacter sp.]